MFGQPCKGVLRWTGNTETETHHSAREANPMHPAYEKLRQRVHELERSEGLTITLDGLRKAVAKCEDIDWGALRNEEGQHLNGTFDGKNWKRRLIARLCSCERYTHGGDRRSCQFLLERQRGGRDSSSLGAREREAAARPSATAIEDHPPILQLDLQRLGAVDRDVALEIVRQIGRDRDHRNAERREDRQWERREWRLRWRTSPPRRGRATENPRDALGPSPSSPEPTGNSPPPATDLSWPPPHSLQAAVLAPFPACRHEHLRGIFLAHFVDSAAMRPWQGTVCTRTLVSSSMASGAGAWRTTTPRAHPDVVSRLDLEHRAVVDTSATGTIHSCRPSLHGCRRVMRPQGPSPLSRCPCHPGFPCQPPPPCRRTGTANRRGW